MLALSATMCPKDRAVYAAAAGDDTTTGIAPPPQSAGQKIIYLIRHAESEENRRIAALSRAARTLGKFALPKSSDVSASAELLNVAAQVDSNVSEIGTRQIQHMGEKLKQADFIQMAGLQLLAHSPLTRARQTSEGMLGCAAAVTSITSTDGNVNVQQQLHPSVGRVVETDLLLEKTPAEWTPLYYSSFKKRIRDFEMWLSQQKEDRIALVGHSQFFKAMLGLDFKFGNCDVWRLDFDAQKMVGSSSTTTTTTITTDDDVATAPTEGEAKALKTSSTTSFRNCKLPPQWSNLQQVFACEVESSPKTV